MRTTPCDYLKDMDGLAVCPYEDYGGGDRCRVCCGLGVDEDSPEEEEDYDPEYEDS